MITAIAIIPTADMPGPMSESLTVPQSAQYVNTMYVDMAEGLTDEVREGYALNVAIKYRDRIAAEHQGNTHCVTLLAVTGSGDNVKCEVMLGSGLYCSV